MNGTPRRVSRLVAPVAVFVLAVTVGLLETSVEDGFNPTAMVYTDVARHMLTGQGVSSSILFASSVPRVPTPMSVWAPLYPTVIALLSWLGVDELIAARVIPLVTSGLSAVLVWLLAGALHGPRVAVASGVLLAIWPAMTRVATNASWHAFSSSLSWWGSRQSP